MIREPVELRAIQVATNRIASRFRQYRRRHLVDSRQDGKFDTILGFVTSRSPAGRLVIDDEAVFEFWVEKSGSGDFRAYRTVFDSFAHFLHALDDAGRAEAIWRAAPIGTDRDKGEIEPDDSAENLAVIGEWASPLAQLDQEPAAAIKFFKKEGERKPMEILMHYGPTATRLPLAFLRLESFGPVQSAITTDLQVGRGRERIERRSSCLDAEPYSGVVAGFETLLEMVKRLQKATFYALHKDAHGHAALAGPGSIVPPDTADSGEDAPLDSAVERVVVDSARMFRAISRKGFDEAGLADEARIEGFRIGADALVTAGGQLEGYLAAVARLDRSGRDLAQRFEQDRQSFSKKFRALYGVAP
jgi:hypothetical protein